MDTVLAELNLRRLDSERRAALDVLLAEADLPFADIRDTDLPHFVGAFDARDRLVGAVGIELYGRAALLRSLAVATGLRSRGIGAALVTAIEQEARALAADTLYLLTTTAEDFFAARGYSLCPREQVPARVRASSEFASVCPASATVMCRSIAES